MPPASRVRSTWRFNLHTEPPNEEDRRSDKDRCQRDKEPTPAGTTTTQHDPAQDKDNAVVADEHQPEQECDAVDHLAASVLRYAVLHGDQQREHGEYDQAGDPQ